MLFRSHYDSFLYRRNEFEALCLVFNACGEGILFVESDERNMDYHYCANDSREFFVLHQYRSRGPLDGDAYLFDEDIGSYSDWRESWIENHIIDSVAQAVEDNYYLQSDYTAETDLLLYMYSKDIAQYMERRNNPQERGFAALCLDLRIPESPRLEFIDSYETVRDLVQSPDYFVIDACPYPHSNVFRMFNPDEIPLQILQCRREHRMLLCGAYN